MLACTAAMAAHAQSPVDADVAAAQARKDKAFSTYTRLATQGGAGDINQAMAEYRSAVQALEAAEARRKASRASGGAAATTAAPPAAAPAVTAPAPALPPAGTVAISLAPFEGFRLDRLPQQAAARDPRVPWSAQAPVAPALDAVRLASYGATLTDAMNKVQVLHGKAPTPVINAHAAYWAPLYAFPTAQNQQYFERLVPALDAAIAAGSEIEALAPAFRNSLAELAITAATGNDTATRVSLQASAALGSALEQQRQKLQESAQRVRQLGDPQNPLAAQASAREMHRAVFSKKVAPDPAAAQAPAQPAPSSGDCRTPFGDCKISDIRMVSTAPKPGTTVVIAPILSSTPPVDGPARTPEARPAQAAVATPMGADAAAQAQQEAIAQHLEVARQREESARRWDADAQREKDPARRQELMDRAEYERDMAQAERDIASSLKTGIIVHTRTDWQNRQAAKLINQMKSELAEFDKDHRRLQDIPKLASMVTGADGQRIQGEIQQRLREAIAAPDRGTRLDQLYAQLKRVVVAQRDAELGQSQAKVAQADMRLATAEGVKAGADAAFWASTWLVPGGGAVSMAYGAGVGYAEGGIVRAVENTARAYSDKIDAGLAAVRAALEVDEQGQRKGLGNALQAGLSTAVLNKLTGVLAGKTTGVVQGGIGKGRPAAGGGTAAPRPEAFKDNHERYREALQGARTPEQRQAVEQQFRVVVARESLRNELAAITRRHEQAIPVTARGPDGGVDVRSPAYQQAKQAWERDMAAARAKYAPQENRMSVHNEALAEGFLTPGDIPLSGGKPQSVMSDMDVAPRDHASGQKYVQAMRKGGRQVLDFPDRWIVPELDMTIWKPGYGADKPGSSSYEAAIVHDALEGSDKFPTQGGVEYTTQAGQTSDPEGAVISNFKKAQEAGIAGGGAVDLHVVGKSLNKALEIAGVAAPQDLVAKAAAVRAHQTADEAGITTFGASAESKARERARFLAGSRSAFADALHASGLKSEASAESLKKQLAEAEARRDAGTAHALRAQLARYTISKRITLQSIANRDPGAVASVLSRRNLPPPSQRGYGWLAEQMAHDRQALQQHAAHSPAAAPALAGVGERCRLAAQQVASRQATARAGSPEAAYLARLKAALDRGVTQPALAVSEVRMVSGHELAEVLAELAPAAARR